MKKQKYYITTSIAYANAFPHIGFALELIQADVLSRYQRFLGKDVFFLTGTDEHGLKIARTAEKEGKKPAEFVKTISKKYKELTKILNISNNDFIRTTDRSRHWPNVKEAWERLIKKGDIYKKKYRGLYCVGCEEFVKGKDLVNGKCPNHQKEPEVVEEENYFFKLSKYAEQIKKEIQADKLRIVPASRKNEILSFISQGVEDVSCSRSRKKLKWGIPVFNDKEQTIYVWFEALLNYLLPREYWPADVHCLGKDIFRFHSLLWPAMLIALSMPRPKNILVHGFITVAGQKMSKSLGNVIDPFELAEKYGTDAVRYFLLREIPATEDGDFTYEKFEQRYNTDLANGLGNLTARVVVLAKKLKAQKLTKAAVKNLKLKKEIDKTRQSYNQCLKEFKLNEALVAVWRLIGWCDRYIEKEKPWSLDSIKEKEKINEVIGDLLLAVSETAKLLEPFLPETSERILKQLKNGQSRTLFPRL